LWCNGEGRGTRTQCHEAKPTIASGPQMADKTGPRPRRTNATHHHPTGKCRTGILSNNRDIRTKQFRLIEDEMSIGMSATI
jgi:hypothetical protein